MISNIITTVITFTLTTLITLSCKNSYKSIQQFKTLNEATRNMLKAEIVQKHNDAIKKGYITDIELDVLHRLNNSYKKLGGNSYIKNLMQNIEKLEIRKENF